MALRGVGFGLLLAYLIDATDFRVSLLWALAVPAIAFSISWIFVGLGLFERFPLLNRYVLYPQTGDTQTPTSSDDEWTLGQANYHLSGSKAIIFTPTEDGLICVPVLLVGMGAVSATLAGAVFGLLHLARFTYLECIAKSIWYALVVLIVLPQGILTVVIGHFLMDLMGLGMLTVLKRQLIKKVRSNPTVEGDARESAARPSP